MSFTLAQLKSEIQTDPAGLGYGPLVASGALGSVASLLNAVGAGAGFSIFRKDVGVRELIAAIDAVNFASLNQLQTSKLTLLFSGTAVLDAADANTRNIVTGIFAGMTATLSNFAAVSKRQGSRAEVLWGAGTVVTDADVALALRS